jgi:hypothetical protein
MEAPGGYLTVSNMWGVGQYSGFVRRFVHEFYSSGSSAKNRKSAVLSIDIFYFIPMIFPKMQGVKRVTAHDPFLARKPFYYDKFH